MVDAVTPSPFVSFVIENRTGEPADLAYIDRATGEDLSLSIAPGAAAELQGEPAALRWLNVPPNPAGMITTEAADALDARREPGTPRWSGLAVREDQAVDNHPDTEKVQ